MKQASGWFMQQVLLAAFSRALVSISGEKGCGKEFTARMIHEQSTAHGVLKVVDASVEPAGGWGVDGVATLVVKDVEALSAVGQAWLMSLILCGGVKVVLCSDAPLLSLVRRGFLRGDLLERCRVVALALPPLRERMQDLPHIIDDLLGRMPHTTLLGEVRLSDCAYAALCEREWAGNVKELERVLLAAAHTTRTGVISSSHL